ncbi:hypothetical protein [Pseudoalteromonas rubra]|uniref:Lipoprotein n=1 Tax=Pseudoalteromonas rubra TaxID=43658 RepID=A0A0U2Y1I2_9GAMM|nr:hypothetical protein [Pseudoalteromonas rubra]ALU44082.1 hypothetical protein AT705_14690 [Pseudoalteromonas rubra]
MRYIILVIFLTLTVSCQRYTDTFRYISLEGNEKVVEVASGIINNPKVKLEKEIVLSYKLERENYSIFFTIDSSGLMPNIIVYSKGRLEQIAPKIVPKRFRKNKKNSISHCNLSYIVRGETAFEIVVPTCFDFSGGNFISFDVLIDSEVVGKEDLKFTLREAGEYETFDGI